MRYLRLYLNFVRFSFSKAMEFRIDFSFRILMDLIYYIVNILFFRVIYLHTPMLEGWQEDQMLLFVSIYLLVDALNMTIFSTNMWWLPHHINKGDLDYYLIRPISPLFFLSLREFSANSFLNLAMAIAIFIAALFNYQGTVDPMKLFLLLTLIVNGTLVYYCIQLLLVLPVFWTQSPRGFSDLFYTLQISMERPDRIYKGALRVLFTFIFPFALIASFPARLFMEKFDIMIFIHLSGISLLLWIAVLTLWKRGLRNYASASS
jgi:ABC-2 type transport system permease protein